MKNLVGFLLVAAFMPLWANAGNAIKENVEKDYPYLQTHYEYFHQHPELSYEERETSARIGDEMRSMGFEVTDKVGGYGVVSVFKNGDGPTVLIRTDMDALPITEMTGLPYASKAFALDGENQKVGLMHACGHDVHMTVFLGTARRLVTMASQWKGTLVMIAQPAEERAGGARAMLSDGLFEKFPRPDYNLALHVSAEYPAGQVAYVAGHAMASVDMVDVALFGIGGHGAYPHKTKDPVVLAAQFISAIQTLISREIAPAEAGVVTVGSIHGGSKHNIISNRVDLELTVRSYTDNNRKILLEGIRRIAKGQAISMGIPEDKWPVVNLRDEHTPALYNDPELTHRIREILSQHFGVNNVVETYPVMGGEDFAEYGRVEPKIPSLLLWLGSVDPKMYKLSQSGTKVLPSLHSALYFPAPMRTLTTGVEAMTVAALELFNETKD